MASSYQLLDFGRGRKLESLAGYVIDRPSPAAAGHPKYAATWDGVDARYHESERRWTFHRPWPEDLQIDCGRFSMPVQPTPYGHLGLFPEQYDNWQWIAETSQQLACDSALNLFAYTGASSLAAAAGGAKVTHVDAAKPNVNAAKVAAGLAGFGDSVRFMTDDARKFVAREQRRERNYQLIILDPPAYGHGPKGSAWRLERDLWPLLSDCIQLLSGPRTAMLITGHSEQIEGRDIVRWLRDRFDSGLTVSTRRAELIDQHNRQLDCGFWVRAEFAR